jgi:glycosyltransferase involved in cell wall biosynthesis
MVHLPYFVPSAGEVNDRVPSPRPGRPFFLYVGRLEKLKGVQDLIRLFTNYQEADLVVVGSGSYSSVLREQARSLPHVVFLGSVHPSSLGGLYRKAIALLVPSLFHETFGIVVAEALSFGTPAIVRRIGALAEIIGQSGAGYIFNSLEECRQAMEHLRTEPHLREQLGQRGLVAFRRYWSVETHLEQYFRLVTSLMERRK